MNRPHIWQIDPENLDLVEQEQLFLKTKELLRIKHDSNPDFPYDVYFEGSEMLRKAANFIDSEIHQYP